MTEYRTYYTSKYDMFVITEDNGTLHGDPKTHIYCKNEKIANKICKLLNEQDNQIEELQKENNKIYEVWYQFYDGTMTNINGYHEKVKTFANKEKAIEEKNKLNEQKPFENPYYIKEVILDD